MDNPTNDDPLGDDYWRWFDETAKQVDADRDCRAARYGGLDPAAGGWRRPSPEDLLAERSALRELDRDDESQ